MDCLRAAETLSAAHDGEPVDAGELAEATEHCSGCASCSMFAETLRRVDALIAPPAPGDLAERIITHISDLAARERAAVESVAVAAEPGPGTRHEGPARAWQRFSPRLVAVASAAAVVLIALATTSVVLLRGAMPQTAGETDKSAPVTLTEPVGAPPLSEGYADDSAMRAAQTAAPPLLSLDGAVYRLVGPAEPPRSTLATAGAVTHALDSTGTPVQRYAYRPVTGGLNLFVPADESGGFLEFTRVVRSLGRTEYGLVTGTPLQWYGQWPTLPARFTAPLSSDGSPTFGLAAKDDLGVDVYIPPSGRIADGFAVAPGTQPSDPAAGNPNWTWWEPLR